MPYEFEDLSKDVAKGAEDVKKGLDGIAQAAEKADEASAKLSDTQRGLPCRYPISLPHLWRSRPRACLCSARLEGVLRRL